MKLLAKLKCTVLMSEVIVPEYQHYRNPGLYYAVALANPLNQEEK